MSPARRSGRSLAAIPLALVIMSGLFAPSGAYAQQQQQQGGGATDVHHGAGFGFGQDFLLSGPDSAFNNNIGFMLNYSLDAGPTWGLWVNLKFSSYSDNTNTQDSLSVKGLVPNLRYNIIKRGQFSLALFVGLGGYLVDEQLNGVSSSFFLFAIDAGVFPYVDLGPLRVGPSLTFTNISTATNTVNTSSSSTGTPSGPTLSAGGSQLELFFNMSYIF